MMLRSAFLIGFAGASITLAQGPSEAAVPELTVDQAVSLALHENRDVRSAKLEIAKSENDVVSARSYRLPSFDLNVFEGQFLRPLQFNVPAGAWGVYPSTGPVPAAPSPITTPARSFTLLEAKAVEPLSRWHSITLGIRIHELLREQGAEKLSAARIELTSRVRNLCYEILEGQSAVEASAHSIATLEEQLRVASESVKGGKALPSEELDVKAHLARAHYDVATLEHGIAERKEQLNDLMGRDLRTQFAVRAPEAAPAALTLAEAQSHALANRPEVREARLEIGRATAEREVKKNERFPEVTLNAEFLSPYRIAFVPENIIAVGFNLKWDVFDWGRRKREIANRGMVVEQAGIALESAQRRILLEVEASYQKMDERQRMLEVAKAAREAAQERERILSERRALEVALPKDVLAAQAVVAQTEHDYQAALLSYLAARAEADRAMGVGR